MEQHFRVAVAGNPNVGKSTIFNGLTGMKRHTGNWAGKTVSAAEVKCRYDGDITIIDIPGTYSLAVRSPEEAIARDVLLRGEIDAAVAVCDACCLERGLTLAVQIMRLCPRTIVCVNLMDEARRKGIEIDLDRLSEKLGVPVIGTEAHKKSSLAALVEAIQRERQNAAPRASLSAAEYDKLADGRALERQDDLVCGIYTKVDEICKSVVTKPRQKPAFGVFDRLITGRVSSVPIMLVMLMALLWLTMVGANKLSELLGWALFSLGDLLCGLTRDAPAILRGVLIDGAYRVTAWVVSVMLPPMAIFFPLFTLLEDCGLLPRIAFNFDKTLCQCGGCGKQALTMCMGLGCNAAGVTGCRIIESRRERLVAMLTNVFIPCNGRLPMLLTLVTMFLSANSLLSAAMLAVVVTAGVLAALAMSKLLSITLLKGEPSPLVLELPPYRLPQFGRVITSSFLDKTLSVLARAVVVAAPAGVVIWLLANITAADRTLLSYITEFLDPLGKLMGMDGVIIAAFLIGIPANEIVIPIMIMAYMEQSALAELAPAQMSELFAANGWTQVTALCVIVFTLMHFPCATTLLTIKREAGGARWAALGFVLPTAAGMLICAIIARAARVLGVF